LIEWVIDIASVQAVKSTRWLNTDQFCISNATRTATPGPAAMSSPVLFNDSCSDDDNLAMILGFVQRADSENLF
jgi:hypothetical protein